MSDVFIAVVITVVGLMVTLQAMWGSVLRTLVMLVCGLFLTVMALSTVVASTQLTAERRRTNFWFYQYLDADSARVECEMAQPIIFPRDTAEIQL